MNRVRTIMCAGYCLLLLLVLTSSLAAQKPAEQAANKDILKYSIKVKPGDVQINRMPPVPTTSYKESFTFTVTNPTRTDFKGEAPTSQLYDIVVFRLDGATKDEVWRWSRGKVFAQVLTPVKINPGKSWGAKADWEFSAKDVKDGEYLAVANYIPSGGTGEVKFKITSTQ